MMLSILWRIIGIEEGVNRRGSNMITQEPIAYLNRGKGKHAYLHQPSMLSSSSIAYV